MAYARTRFFLDVVVLYHRISDWLVIALHRRNKPMGLFRRGLPSPRADTTGLRPGLALSKAILRKIA